MTGVGPLRCRMPGPIFLKIGAISSSWMKSTGEPCKHEIGDCAGKASRQSFSSNTASRGSWSNALACIPRRCISRLPRRCQRVVIGHRSQYGTNGITEMKAVPMIDYKSGDILKADAEALINTVNCVGVMGRGIALQFKNAYPKNFSAYQQACKRHEVQP